MEGPGVPLSSRSADDLGSKGAPFSTAPAVVLTLLAGGGPGPPDDPDQTNAQNRPVRHAGTGPIRRVMIVAGMRSAEDCYRSDIATGSLAEFFSALAGLTGSLVGQYETLTSQKFADLA